MKVQITPFVGFQPSKHRNSKKQSITFVDASGKKIAGNPQSHFSNVFTKQQERFNLKFEAFSLLSEQEQKELYLKPTKPQVSSSTDRIALEQAYYNSCFNAFKAQSTEDLESIKGNTLDNLNDVQKRALTDSIKLKEKELLTQK